MVPVQKILAPVDFSEVCEVSSQYALDLARAFQAEILFLHVIPQFSLSARLFFPHRTRYEESKEILEEENRKARVRLDAFLQRFHTDGIRCTCLLEKGEPFVKILQTADAMKPDVVVQGIHGTTGLEKAVLGGTAERVIRQTKCPVISIKPRDFGTFLHRFLEGIGLSGGDRKDLGERVQTYRFPPRKVLYPTDFSEASRLAMDYAAQIAKKADAELVVLHMTEEELAEGNESEPMPRGDREGEEALPALDRMEDLIREMSACYDGLKVSPRIRKAAPASGILSVTFEEGVDMVVMGTQGHTGLGALLAGTTADRLIRNAPCPVLTVRPNWKMEEVERRFRKIFRNLSPLDLQRMNDQNRAIIDDDLLGDPSAIKKSTLFLNYYSQEGLGTALEEYGINDLLRRRGFDGFLLRVKVDDLYRHCVRVYAGGKEDPSHLLIELVLREGSIRSSHSQESEEVIAAGAQHSVLIIEWLCLQNPTAPFAPDRPPMPGQPYPGLGIGHEILGLLIQMARRTRKDGLMNRPQYFHNARVYRERFKFFNPVREGQLVALIRDTNDDDLTDVSWAIHHGCLRDAATGERVLWEGGNQIYPMSPSLKDHFTSRQYRNMVWDTASNMRYRIDWDCFAACMRKEIDSVHTEA